MYASLIVDVNDIYTNYIDNIVVFLNKKKKYTKSSCIIDIIV